MNPRATSSVGSSPVMDLDFSVMMDITALTAVKGYIREPQQQPVPGQARQKSGRRIPHSVLYQCGIFFFSSGAICFRMGLLAGVA